MHAYPLHEAFDPVFLEVLGIRQRSRQSNLGLVWYKFDITANELQRLGIFVTQATAKSSDAVIEQRLVNYCAGVIHTIERSNEQ